MVELTKTSVISSTDMILKDFSDMDSSDTEGIKSHPRSIQNLKKKSFGEVETALQQNSQKFIKKMFLREIYPKKKVQQRETLVPKSIQFDGNAYDGLA